MYATGLHFNQIVTALSNYVSSSVNFNFKIWNRHGLERLLDINNFYVMHLTIFILFTLILIFRGSACDIIFIICVHMYE